ncbi:ABC transporter ATP-binding protein [Allorhizocola rhizosphaerae]|uniref:ABC transporter ATP-binding protein n=1 Tax=Allorhizocola rhizosphaerae TaxID=1872709 RepID=UPI000E3E379F|nr:ABC transporter ATP-binding protein [Allorhizocola rhizosphaerae]
MIEGRGITKAFKQVQALRGVDFVIPRGGAVSFIGESGCGKTTLGRILAGLESHDEGRLLRDGEPIKDFRPIQLIHQDPYSALNPTRTIAQILRDPLRLRGHPFSKAEELLSLVGLDPSYVLSRYPHQLSGGMRQRVVIARALTVDPEVLVADEAVSMIDVSLRLGILALLRNLRETLGVSVLFITHDVATARYVGAEGELYVIYRGTVVERGPVDTVLAGPVHPYTQCLLSAIPVLHGLEVPGPDRLVPDEPLDERVEPSGCLFEPRCPFATPACAQEQPLLSRLGDTPQDHACLFPARRHVVAVPAR